MYRTPVTSSNVKAIGFDANVLEVEYDKGRIYQYFGVPTEVYQLLMNSPSKGTYLNQFVKPYFECKQIA